MKNLYIIEIEGSNIANVKYAFQNEFKIKLIKQPKEIEDINPNIILPGNGSFSHYISFLEKNNWKDIFENIIFNNSGKLITICSGFQSLGESSNESPGIKGLGIINMKFEEILKLSESSLQINIGRKQIFKLEKKTINDDLTFLNSCSFENINYPFFVHGFTSSLNDHSKDFKLKKFTCLYSLIDDSKILAGLISNNFCGTQFHPELSGESWRSFMLEFLDN